MEQALRQVVLLTLPCTDCATSIVLINIYSQVEQHIPATDDDLVLEIRFRTLAFVHLCVHCSHFMNSKLFELHNSGFSSFSVHVKCKWEKKRDWVVPLCWSFQGLKLSWRCPHPLECDGKTSLATASPNRFRGPRDGAQWRRWPPIEHCTGHRKDKELYSGRRSDHALLCSGGRAEGDTVYCHSCDKIFSVQMEG